MGMTPVLVVTTDTVIDRKTLRSLGLVRGSTVRSKHIGADIIASLRALVGGEMHEYSSMIAGAREQALDRMIFDARKLGANAVTGVRFESAAISQGASEVMCYGTACIIED